MSDAIVKNIPLNLITNFFVFILGIMINLVMTPFYIKYLGVDGLGVVRLALLLPVYVNLGTLIISGVSSRFLTIDLQKKEYKDAMITFNTSLFSISSILIFTMPIIIYVSFHITSYMNIPKQYAEDSTYLFLGIFLYSQITIFSTLFLIPAYAKNRLDIQNWIKSLVLIVQASFIFGTFNFLSIKISYIGYSYFISSLVAIVISIIIWKKYAPFMKLSINFFNYLKFKEMASMGSWLLVNQLGSMLFLSVDLIIINHYFGSKSTGEYSMALQWSTLLRALAGTIASIVTPVILISYANNNLTNIIKYTNFSVKFMGIFISIPIGLILGFSYPLLSLWVGNEYTYLIPLLWIMIVHLIINLSVLPLFSIYTAYNKVRIPGLMSLFFGILNFILAIFLAVKLEYGIYGVALAGAITLTMKNAIFMPLYAAFVLNISLFSFIRYLFQGIVVFLVSYGIAYSVSLIGISSWLGLICSGLVSFILILSFIWIFVLTKEDKLVFKEKILRKTR